jgi:hypothetical protein
LALVQLVPLPDRSQAEQAGSFPSHLILADLHLAQAATGRETRKDGFKSASIDSVLAMASVKIGANDDQDITVLL